VIEGSSCGKRVHMGHEMCALLVCGLSYCAPEEKSELSSCMQGNNDMGLEEGEKYLSSPADTETIEEYCAQC